MKHTAIILAAGTGSRMKSDVAKQYIELKNIPLICHTLMAFECSKVDDIVLVVGPKDVEKVQRDIVDEYGFSKVKTVVAGGATRSASVMSGIRASEGTEYVHIHDGARCLVTSEIVNEMISSVEAKDAVALAVPVKDTIRRVTDSGWYDKSMDRSDLHAMQTPQSFEYKLIRAAFENMKADVSGPEMTDDVMVLEVYGDKRSFFIPGSPENIKVTTPEDLLLAEAIINKREKEKAKKVAK